MKHMAQVHTIRVHWSRVRCLRSSAFIRITQTLDYHLASPGRWQQILSSLPRDLLLLLLKLLAQYHNNQQVAGNSEWTPPTGSCDFSHNELVNVRRAAVTPDGVACLLSVVKARCAHLTRLDLQRTTFSASAFATLVASMRNLISLNLSSTSCNDHTLYSISRNCVHLVELYLESCDEITDVGLCHLMGHARETSVINEECISEPVDYPSSKRCIVQLANSSRNQGIGLVDLSKDWLIQHLQSTVTPGNTEGCCFPVQSVAGIGCLQIRVLDIDGCSQITAIGVLEVLQLKELTFLRHKELNKCLETLQSVCPDNSRAAKLRHLSYSGEITSQQFLSCLPSLPLLASLEMEISEKPWVRRSDRWAEAQHVLGGVGHNLTQLTLVHHFGKCTYEGFPVDIGDLYRLCPNLVTLKLKGMLLGDQLANTGGCTDSKKGALSLQYLFLEGCDGLTDSILYALLHRATHLRTLCINQGPALYRDWLTHQGFQRVVRTNPLLALQEVKLNGVGNITLDTVRLLVDAGDTAKTMHLTNCKLLPETLLRQSFPMYS